GLSWRANAGFLKTVTMEACTLPRRPRVVIDWYTWSVSSGVKGEPQARRDGLPHRAVVVTLGCRNSKCLSFLTVHSTVATTSLYEVPPGIGRGLGGVGL